MKRSPRLRLAGIVASAATLTMLAAACGSGGSSSGSGGGSGAGSTNTASAPGITSTQILIGSHQPLTGVAAPGYSEIAPASNAYFQYVNAHGGVYGRKIMYKFLDDGYNPSQTVSVVHQLVLQNSVYAIFDGLGTPTHLAVVDYLNSAKVPDVFVASGCECWNMPSTHPETFGWQLDYVREGKILGQYIKQHFPGKKIGYFYQNDEFGQDGIKGLSYEIPASQVVSKQSYVPTNINIGAQVAALKAAGAQVVVSFSVPAFTALLRLNSLKLNYAPTLAVSNVGSDPITLAGLLQAFAKQGGANVNGTALTQGMITDGYAPSVGQTSNSWIALFKKIHDTYDAKAPFDGNVLYGEAVAYTFVQAMLKAGRNPSRAALVSAIEGGLQQGPAVAPYAYSHSDHAGMTGAFVGVVKSGAIVPQTPVMTTDTSASGPVSNYTGSQPPAPASGLPPH
jgi:ABC-type branched-subunit amino acid transport system substrate-binding protein